MPLIKEFPTTRFESKRSEFMHMKFFKIKKTWRSSIVLQLLAMVLLLVGSTGAWATCSFNAGSSTGTLNLSPPTPVTVPRDAVAGTVLADSGWIATPGSAVGSCDTTSLTIAEGITTPVTLVSTTPILGVTATNAAQIYDSGIPGIGFAMMVSTLSIGQNPYYWTPVATRTTTGTSFSGQQAWHRVIIVKYSAGATGGGVTTRLSGTSASRTYTQGNTLTVFRVNLVSEITVKALACQTPNVIVPLGTHSASEFASSNVSSSTSFNISMNSCPAAMNSIQYRVDPTTTVLNSAQSVVALDSSSSATGVGVQLLDGTGAVFPLSTYKTFSGYSKSSGGSYTIPFKGRYYMTGTSVGVGVANTSMTFTMLYQ